MLFHREVRGYISHHKLHGVTMSSYFHIYLDLQRP
uniref:Uncharacterized protein n=1 Tax=Rhizophora mucronata TaxID=61149 RepID=A0A2P2JYW5_RHIMU